MMSCIRPRTEEELRSKQIDKEFADMSKQFEAAIKILLLGTGESGKTTIIKQMKILHINGFTQEERLEKTREIRQNIHESITDLVLQMPLLNLDFDNLKNKRSAEYIIDMGKIGPQVLNQEYVDHVATLWFDSGVRECYRRSNEFQLIDSAKYFLDKLEIVAKPDYSPTIEDILHSRKITTGIHEITFKVKIPKDMGKGYQDFRMFDVGGQRDQRNKWLQVFDGIQAVLFIISCGDFDQTLREDVTENRLQEAITLFSKVWHNRFLMSSGIIVFLNKQDIMEEKIKAGKSIRQYFPEYENFRLSSDQGNVFDESNRTRHFIKQKLEDITKEPPRRVSRVTDYTPRECYFHFTVATNTDNIKTVFNDVHNFILMKNLAAIGML